MEKLKNYKLSGWWLVLLLPALFTAILILARGVNVPVLDDWELVPVIQHAHAGHFQWSDFWLQHNEHRIFFPQLIMLGSALLTAWNTQAECFVSLLVALASFGLVLRLVKEFEPRFWLLGLMSLIWFSPVQLENWLWGWQVQWFMNVFGAILVAFGLSGIKQYRLSHRQLLLVIGGALLAEYSLGNGILLWLLALAILMYKKVYWRQTSLVAMSGLAATGLYFWHYVNPTEPSKTLVLHEPVSYINYVLIYLGRPLTFFHHLAAGFGLLALGLFVAISWYLYRNQNPKFDRLLPWTMLGLYAVGSAAITGIARLGLGTNEAYSSRYTTISSLLLVSILVSLWAARAEIRRLLKESYGFLAPAFVVGSLILVIGNYAWGSHAANGRHRELSAIKQCTSMAQPSSSCLLRTYPNLQIAQQRLDYLKQIHWAGY